MPQRDDAPARREGRAFGVPRRREELIALLTEAYARNDLEQGEFERRLELAEQARTIEELDAVIADFPPDVVERYGAPSAAAGMAGTTGKDLERQIENLDGMAAPTRFSLIGDQRVAVLPAQPRVLRTVAVIGDTRVDLRALSGMPGVFLLKVATLIGDTTVIVPRGTQVETRLFCLIGDQSRGRKKDGFLSRLARRIGGVPEKAPESQSLPGPTVVITGYKLIGDTAVIED